MTVLVICKFDEDSIKSDVAIVRPTFSLYMFIGDLRASNSHANSPICLKIKLVQGFMAVLIICKSEEESIKNEVAIVRPIFSPFYVYGRLKGK